MRPGLIAFITELERTRFDYDALAVARYTLYTLPGDQPVHDVTAPGDTDRWAFVHVLDLENGYDFCLFLPQPMGQVNEATMGVGLSPDGTTLWVADPAAGLMARLDTVDLEVKEVVEVPEILDPTRRADVAVADDGTVYVSLGWSIHEFAPDTLERTAVWQSRVGGGPAPAPVDELSMSANSAVLMFTAGGRVTLIDRETGLEVATLAGPDGESLRILGPPSGSAVQIPLECAC